MSTATNRFAGTTGHPVGETKTGFAVGMDKGHVVTKLEQKQRPSYRKGKLNKRVAFVRQVVKEVVGFSPYEKRCMELLKVRSRFRKRAAVAPAIPSTMVADAKHTYTHACARVT